MGYVAVKGGEAAIANAERYALFERAGGHSKRLEINQITEQLHAVVDRLMGEGSLYAPDLAALAFKQAAGDTFEAAFILRSYRTTLPRFGCSEPVSTDRMRVIRRISAAFKDIPGGQILGPTSDYSLRLLNMELQDESTGRIQGKIRKHLEEISGLAPLPEKFHRVVDTLRQEGLLVNVRQTQHQNQPIDDVTREALSFPASRSAKLQTLARGETGGMLALAYSNMRGYGSVHPVIGELRVGYLPVYMRNPLSEEKESIGEIKLTEAEIISRIEDTGKDTVFSIGYGACFGHNETKAISMAVLDRATETDSPTSPSEDQEFVLTHIDGIESMGFCNHYKLPHYVTFQSELDRLRSVQVQRRQKDAQ